MKTGNDSFWKRHKAVLKAWLTFVAAYVVLLALLFTWPGTVIDRWFTIGTARTTAFALSVLGLQGKAQDDLVTSSIYTVKIVSECTAVFPIMVFIAAILAYPAPFRKKLIGIGIGVPAILLINLFRLISLFYIGRWFPDAFHTMHLLVWQSLIIFFTIVIWLVWTSRVSRAHAV